MALEEFEPLGLSFDIVETYQLTKYTTALYSVPSPMLSFVVKVGLPWEPSSLVECRMR